MLMLKIEGGLPFKIKYILTIHIATKLIRCRNTFSYASETGILL